MLLLLMLLPLGTLLHQALGKDENPILSELTEEKKQEILTKINNYRRKVKPTASNMLKMTWTEEGSKTAKEWAAQCQLRSSPDEARTTNGVTCGEAISQSTVPKSWSDTIEAWASTSSYFTYGVGPTDPKKNIYTYTQLIWYRSHKIGCAAAYCPKLTSPFLYVCHFCPGGNLKEEINTPYKEGVPCGDCPNDCEDKLCTNPCNYYDKTPNCNEIMGTFTCETRFGKHCEATCKCTTEIK